LGRDVGFGIVVVAAVVESVGSEGCILEEVVVDLEAYFGREG